MSTWRYRDHIYILLKASTATSRPRSSYFALPCFAHKKAPLPSYFTVKISKEGNNVKGSITLESVVEPNVAVPLN